MRPSQPPERGSGARPRSLICEGQRFRIPREEGLPMVSMDPAIERGTARVEAAGRAANPRHYACAFRSAVSARCRRLSSLCSSWRCGTGGEHREFYSRGQLPAPSTSSPPGASCRISVSSSRMCWPAWSGWASAGESAPRLPSSSGSRSGSRGRWRACWTDPGCAAGRTVAGLGAPLRPLARHRRNAEADPDRARGVLPGLRNLVSGVRQIDRKLIESVRA